MLRQGVSFLESRNEIGRSLFTKGQEPLRKDRDYQYRHEPGDMLRALESITERSKRQLPPPIQNFKGIVGKEPFPVTKKATEIIRRLVQAGKMLWRQLFRGCGSRTEIVATFLAVLELCRNDSVMIDGDTSEDNPALRLVKPPEEALRKETD